MLNDEEARRLLDKLCVLLGFCLAPSEVERLVNDPPMSDVAFTDEVFRSEGLDPRTVDRQLYRQVLHVVSAAFRATADR